MGRCCGERPSSACRTHSRCARPHSGVPDVQYKDRPVSVPVDVPIPVPVGVPSRPAPFSIFPDHHALSLFANTMPPAPGAAAAGAAQAAALGMSPLLGAYNAQVSPQHPLHPANPLNPARLSDMPPFSLTNPSQHVPDPSATASRVELVPVVLPNGMTMRVPRDMLARTVDAGGAADPVVSDDVARAALAADERLQRLAVAREAWLQRLAAAGSGAPDLLEAGPDLSGVGPDPLAELAGAALPPTSRFSSAQQQVLVQQVRGRLRTRRALHCSLTSPRPRQARVRDAMRRSMSAVGQQDQLAAHLADDIARQQVLLQSVRRLPPCRVPLAACSPPPPPPPPPCARAGSAAAAHGAATAGGDAAPRGCAGGGQAAHCGPV